MLKRQSLLVIFCSILFFANASFAAGINWQSYSSSAFAKAKKENRLVLIFGKAEWCHWCQSMKKNTYTNSAVIREVNAHFVPVYVDIDNNSAIANRYQISGVPTTIILDSNYRVVKSASGYMSAGEMTSFLRDAAR